MKNKITKNFIEYIAGNFTGNFLGFIVGMASAKLVSHFFTTRKLSNLWGLTARKTVLDHQTFNFFEWLASAVIGFIVFEIISKWVKYQLNKIIEKNRSRLPEWLIEKEQAA